MKKHPLQEAKPTEAYINPSHTTDTRADLLAHGSPTQEHIDPATGRVPEGLYEATGSDRMQVDVIAAANAKKHEQ